MILNRIVKAGMIGFGFHSLALKTRRIIGMPQPISMFPGNFPKMTHLVLSVDGLGGENEVCFDARPHLFPLPPGEDYAANGFWLAESCPTNPAARIFRKAADDSPSPRRRGRGEVERETI
jgi:hypothetical protein